MYFGLEEMLRIIKEWFIRDSKTKSKKKKNNAKSKVAKKSR